MRLAAAVLAALGFAAALTGAFAGDPLAVRLPDSVPERAIMSNGTGFFVSSSGAVVTARHVVQGCKNLLVMKNRNLYPVRRAVIANNMDVSLLFPAIQVAAPAVIEADNALHDGDPVYFLGDNDLRLAGSDRPMIADAVIAADQAEESTEYLFHITGNSVPGYSGAPVLNTKGHVIGLILGREQFERKMRSLVMGSSSSVLSVTPIAIKKLLDANRVPYRTGDSSDESLGPPQLVAERISVGVICIK